MASILYLSHDLLGLFWVVRSYLLNNVVSISQSLSEFHPKFLLSLLCERFWGEDVFFIKVEERHFEVFDEADLLLCDELVDERVFLEGANDGTFIRLILAKDKDQVVRFRVNMSLRTLWWAYHRLDFRVTENPP